MSRFYIFLCLSFLSCSWANASETAGACVVDASGSFNITGDAATANIGDQIGTFDALVDVESCGDAGGHTYNERRLHLAGQNDFSVSDGYCVTTVPSIVLSVGPIGNPFAGECVYVNGLLAFGPNIGEPFNRDSAFPLVRSVSLPLIKVAPIAPGIIDLGLQTPKFIMVYSIFGHGTRYQSDLSAYIPPGEVIGTSCSLVTTNIVVPFGNVSGPGAVEPFNIEFGSCTDQADALAFNQAVSLSFVSDRIRADGTALRNGTCSGCAPGLQIAVQDGRGTPVNLSTPYSLSSNPSVVIGPTDLSYSFFAELQANPDEVTAPGVIDTQMIFETVVE